MPVQLPPEASSLYAGVDGAAAQRTRPSAAAAEPGYSLASPSEQELAELDALGVNNKFPTL